MYGMVVDTASKGNSKHPFHIEGTCSISVLNTSSVFAFYKDFSSFSIDTDVFIVLSDWVGVLCVSFG